MADLIAERRPFVDGQWLSGEGGELVVSLFREYVGRRGRVGLLAGHPLGDGRGLSQGLAVFAVGASGAVWRWRHIHIETLLPAMKHAMNRNIIQMRPRMNTRHGR